MPHADVSDAGLDFEVDGRPTLQAAMLALSVLCCAIEPARRPSFDFIVTQFRKLQPFVLAAARCALHRRTKQPCAAAFDAFIYSDAT